MSKNGIQTVDLTGDKLGTYFTVNSDLELLGEDGFTFLVTGEDSQMLPDRSLSDTVCADALCRALLGELAAAFFWYWLFFWYAGSHEQSRDKVSFPN